MSSVVIISVIAAVVGAWLFWVLARRAVSLMIRLVLAGIVILALIFGSLVWWWYGSSSPVNGPQKESRPATRRANSR